MAQTPAKRWTEGRVVPYTPSTDVAAGEVVEIGSIPLVAIRDIAANTKGDLDADGIWRIPKTADAFSAGDSFYWDADGNPVTGTAGSGAATGTAAAGNLMGFVLEAAAEADSYLLGKLTAAKRTATIAGSVTADDITGSDSALTIAGKAGVDDGTGGALNLVSGASAGATGTAGNLSIDCGAANGGTAGDITIGGANAAKITMGKMPLFPAATVAAAGSAQGDAAAIALGITWATAADATKGVKLPAAAAGQVCIVKNDDTANAVLKVYPNTDDTINALAANASLSMAAKTSAIFVCYDATKWFTVPLLPS